MAERQVILWMGQGLLDDETIGKKLHRSPNTVRTQIGSIFHKLGLHSRGEVLNVLRQMMAAPPPKRETTGSDENDSSVFVDPNRTR